MSTKHPSVSPASGEKKKRKAIILEMKFKIILSIKAANHVYIGFVRYSTLFIK